MQAQDKAQFAQVNDKRITRLGHFLRKSRLDEILRDLNAPFAVENALIKIAAAQNCYTGKGCHG